MSTRSDPVLRLEPRPSPRLGFLLLAGCTGAALLPWGSAAPTGLALALTVGAFGAGAAGVRTWLLRRGPRAVRELRRSGAGEWRIAAGDGREHPVVLTGDRFVTPWLVILRLRPLAGGRAFEVVLAADAVPAEPFRRLRAILKAGG